MLRASQAEWWLWEGVKNLRQSQRYTTEQCAWHIHSRECLSCTEFFVGLGASEEAEAKGWYCQFFFFFQQEVSSTVLNALQATDRGSRQTTKVGAVVEGAWQNCSGGGMTEWGKQFYCGLGGKILLNRANLEKLAVTGFGGLTNEVFQGYWQSQGVGLW